MMQNEFASSVHEDAHEAKIDDKRTWKIVHTYSEEVKDVFKAEDIR
jgi:hypothetical protein